MAQIAPRRSREEDVQFFVDERVDQAFTLSLVLRDVDADKEPVGIDLAKGAHRVINDPAVPLHIGRPDGAGRR